jgi:hypothetical protein
MSGGEKNILHRPKDRTTMLRLPVAYLVGRLGRECRCECEKTLAARDIMCYLRFQILTTVSMEIMPFGTRSRVSSTRLHGGSEGYVILGPTQLIISLLLTFALFGAI